MDNSKNLATHGPRIKLGDINARIAPLSITAEGLAQIGFPPVGKEGAAKLYNAADFPGMVDAMVSKLKDSQGAIHV